MSRVVSGFAPSRAHHFRVSSPPYTLVIHNTRRRRCQALSGWRTGSAVFDGAILGEHRIASRGALAGAIGLVVCVLLL